MRDSQDFDYEVITPLAAVVLFGRSGQAVRLASREGRVRTELVFYLERHAVRFIELESAKAYWGKHLHENELKAMQEKPIFLEFSGLRYKVLHPNGFIFPRPSPTPSRPNIPETWFKGDKE